MKDEKTSWQEWYEDNPRPRRKIIKRVNTLVYGVGVNDADYTVVIAEKIGSKQIQIYKCRYYMVWESMLKRCYSLDWSGKYPTYEGLSVCEEFKTFSLFRMWMVNNKIKEGDNRLQLDKDILYPANRVYSPSTCAFVPQFINMTLNICERSSGDMPKGVECYTLKSGEVRYKWTVHAASGVIRGSGLVCKWKAHREWQLARASVIDAAIEKYKLMNCYREDVSVAVRARADKLRYDESLGLETTRLP